MTIMASLSEPDIRSFLSHGTRTGKLAWTARDGRPLVAPVWFLLEGEGDDATLVFNTGAGTAKGRALARDPRVALSVDLEEPPFAFVQVQGTATLSEDPDELLRTSTAIGGRYMGADRATEFGKRNAVPGELVVRVRPAKVVALLDVTA
jgi:PPOX class probable F420-dependent enzyme